MKLLISWIALHLNDTILTAKIHVRKVFSAGSRRKIYIKIQLQCIGQIQCWPTSDNDCGEVAKRIFWSVRLFILWLLLIWSNLTGNIYETVQIKSKSLLKIHYLAQTFRNFWNPFSQIPPFLFSTPGVQLLYTWSHTVNFTPLCVFKISYSCHCRGAHFGQVLIWNGLELVQKWNADRNLLMPLWVIKAVC